MSAIKKLKIKLHDIQYRIYEAIQEYRFVVVSAGRQSGKTFLGVFLIFQNAQTKPNTVNWWVSPTYPTSKIAFRRLSIFLADNEIKVKTNKSELRIEFDNGSAIEFKSADREDGLRGESVNFMIIDEMGVVKRDAWTYALRGTITATLAKVLFIGTPKGKNLFHELFVMGQDDEEKDYISFQYSSNESPYFSADEWVAVQQLPERVFQQEYQAKFLDDGGEVFRNIRACVKGQLEPYNPHRNKSYFAGVDLAKSVDYSVICIINQDAHLVYFDRFKDVSWNIQKERIIKACGQYNAYTLIDSTGLGDPILEDLMISGIRVDGFKFSNISKRQIIEKLAMGIERETISFPDIPELINELNIFTFETLPSGMLRYAAPDGLHDDIVMALALAFNAHGGLSGYASEMFTAGNKRITSEMDF